MTKSKKRGECLLIVLLAIFALGCMLTVSSGVSLGLKNERITPQMYSDILCWCMLALLAARLVMVLRTPTRESENAETPVKTWPLVLFVMACGILYVLGIRYIGFYITTVLMLFVLHMAFERWDKRQLWRGAAFAVGVCVLFYIVFNFLKIYLPNALLF